jgi:hypothetical protein
MAGDCTGRLPATHSAVGRLALPAGYSTSVKRCRQLSRSVVSALEQVGEHSESSVSCLALLGSDGIAGGCAAGAQSVDLELQPVTSPSSISSIPARSGKFPLPIFLYLVYGHLPAALLFSGCSGGAAIALRYLQPIVTQARFGLGLRRLSIRHIPTQPDHPQLLRAADQAGQQQTAQQRPGPARNQLHPGDHWKTFRAAA